MVSKCTSLPTKRYFEESLDMEYQTEKKGFESMSITCRNEEGSPTKKIYQVCNKI